MNTPSPVCFFFGANTPKGFSGFHQTDLYDPRDGWVAFLIKSGAGTGKSTFMHRVLDELTAMELSVESVVCSSDPHSLDAVICHDMKLCVIDATSPHIIEPVAYGECEQLVPFGCCLRADGALAQADAWFEAADACKASHARCCRFLSAAAVLLDNNRRLQESTVLSDKLDTAAARLAAKEFGGAGGRKGRITRRFLSAVTPDGHVFLKDTPTALCPRIYAFLDEHGAVASSMISRLCERAVAAGHDGILCPCPLSEEKGEHLLIPSLGVGFLTSNSHHRIDYPVFRRIHATRFTDSVSLKAKKQQLSFNRRAADELIGEAVAAMRDAKAHHDRMEQLHSAVMDWESYRVIAEDTLDTIRHIVKQRIDAAKKV